MDARTLYDAIIKVCPTVSTSVGKSDDRGTWLFTPDQGATQSQIDAGNNVVETIPVDILPPLTPAQFIMRFTDAEYAALKNKYTADLAADDASGIRVWDIVLGTMQLNMNSDDAQTLKADLVADGILTQARADEIFTSAVFAATMFI